MTAKSVLLSLLFLSACGRNTPSPPPYVHAGVPCGFGYVMEKNGAPPITPEECAVILNQFEVGRNDYLARRQGLSELQRATLASYHIGYVDIYKQAADGIVERGGVQKPFIWAGEGIERIEANAYTNILSQTIYYVDDAATGVAALPHEFQHWFEYKMFPEEGRFQCIGHGHTPTCKDPLAEVAAP